MDFRLGWMRRPRVEYFLSLCSPRLSHCIEWWRRKDITSLFISPLLHHRLLPLCDLFHFNRGEIFLRIIRVRSWMREFWLTKERKNIRSRRWERGPRRESEKERKEKSAMHTPAFKRGSSRWELRIYTSHITWALISAHHALSCFVHVVFDLEPLIGTSVLQGAAHQARSAASIVSLFP